MKCLIPFCLLLLLAACGANNDNDVEDLPVAGTKWILTELNGKKLSDLPKQNREPYINLSPTVNTAEGTGGCNATNANYAIDGPEQIRFFRILSTKMACPDMTVESAFQLALDRTKSYKIRGNIFVLYGEDNKELLKFAGSK